MGVRERVDGVEQRVHALAPLQPPDGEHDLFGRGDVRHRAPAARVERVGDHRDGPVPEPALGAQRVDDELGGGGRGVGPIRGHPVEPVRGPPPG